MKTIKPINSKQLSGIVQSGQEAIHSFSDHARATAVKSRRRLDSRDRNVLLRELGQLHYDARQKGTELDAERVNRVLTQLDEDSASEETDDAADG